MNYDMKLFSKRLQKVRGEKTQVEFSKELGIATASLSAYENNARNPSLAVAIDIAQKCGVSLDWLCGTEARNVNLGDVIRIITRAFENGKLPIIKEYMERLQEVRGLLDKDLIDKDLYDLWIKDQIEKHSNGEKV